MPNGDLKEKPAPQAAEHRTEDTREEPLSLLGGATAALGAPVLQRKLAQRRLQRKSMASRIQSDSEEHPGEQVHEIAAAGLRGAAGPLPHSDTIQAAFGSHDVSGITAHVGGPAARASESLGAAAYATGDAVAFGSSPDLHTAAHEAAHVVQQRAGVHLKGGIGKEGDAYERHADAVADRVVRGESAEALLSAGISGTTATTARSEVVQASFISYAAKMGAKKASKAMLKKFIKEQIKDKISKIAIKKFAKQFAKEADDILGILEDPWWVTAVGFIPIIGDAFDLVHVPKQIAKAIKTADRLEDKVKHVLHIQGRRASELLPARLKRSESYAEELAEKTYAEIVELAGSSERAAKMKKLIEQEARLMEKL